MTNLEMAISRLVRFRASESRNGHFQISKPYKNRYFEKIAILALDPHYLEMAISRLVATN